jgi:hypothetical protein
VQNPQRASSLHLRRLADTPDVDGASAALNSVVATSDGIALSSAYMRIRDPNVRRAIVALVEQITAEPSGAGW